MESVASVHAGFDTVAHVIQVALTPIFLLTGIAALLSTFSIRHSYVTQHVNGLLAEIAANKPIDLKRLHRQFRNLRRRSVLLDVAVVFGILGGSATCASAMLLFLGELDDSSTGRLLFSTFGAALVFTVIAMAAFAIEMMLAGSGMRLRMAEAEAQASDGSPEGVGMA